MGSDGAGVGVSTAGGVGLSTPEEGSSVAPGVGSVLGPGETEGSCEGLALGSVEGSAEGSTLGEGEMEAAGPAIWSLPPLQVPGRLFTLYQPTAVSYQLGPAILPLLRQKVYWVTLSLRTQLLSDQS